jgi:hypothetical protein
VREEHRRAKQDSRERDLLEAVFEGLDYASGATGAAQTTLLRARKIARGKSKKLHMEWRDAVYDKIADRIHKAVEARSVSAVEARLRQQLQSYLTAANNKAAIFLDCVHDDGYDPFAALRHCIKFSSADVLDPVKRDVNKSRAEAEAVRANPFLSSGDDVLANLLRQTHAFERFANTACCRCTHLLQLTETGDTDGAPCASRAGWQGNASIAPVAQVGEHSVWAVHGA